MKNLKYFPFERNRYFYGKLLTVSDFEVEQKYVNDKRRMLNRFLYGSGVVCGMNAVRVDDTTVSVEMGMALDFSGREIVIDAPVIKKLNMIEGFDSELETEGDAGYLYLCLEYAEKEKEAVHSITSSNARGSAEMEFNKFAETYRLFLTGQEPENEGFTTEHYYLDTKTVYWGHGIRVKQVLPRYTRTEGETELKIIVENMGQQQPFGFRYDLDLICLESGGSSRMTVSFHEKDVKQARRYELTYPLKALSVKDTNGTATVAGDTIRLSIGEKEMDEPARCMSMTSIGDRDAKRELMDNYYRTAMEEIVKNTFQQSIYLAKIGIIKAGPAYVIESIENMPFRQYVFNNALASAVNDIEIREIAGLQAGGIGAAGGAAWPAPAGRHGASQIMATGTVVLDLGIGGQEGQRFYSPEITHGLGLGPVSIILGEAYTTSDDSELLFGDPQVFEDIRSTSVANVALGARVNVTKGTFVIGALVITPTNARKLKVSWMAVRDSKESIHDLETKRIFVKPDMANIEVRKSCYFEAIFANIADKRIKWKVKEAEGGTIDDNGMYTAPNSPGVYEIVAESLAHPELKATTYVVVRDSEAVEN
ncbi:MAG: hypothetical protein LBH09_07670 [Peptococcaceae bacterium]|nr:hypothetical protein [Peptococcaceae bacterium]